ncbi:MAG: hypothetical protein WCJ13_08005 [Coriobacteriia bacterium]
MTKLFLESTMVQLTSFEWSRMSEAEWVDSESDRVLVGGLGEEYAPLKDEPALFRKFAELDDTEAAFAGFARKYGDYKVLDLTMRHVRGAESSSPLSGHPLTHWQQERQKLAQAVRLWEALKSGHVGGVVDSDVKMEPTGDAVRVRFKRPADSKWETITSLPKSSSDRRAVQTALAALVTRGCAGVNTALAVSGPKYRGVGVGLTFAVSDLMGAMWLQLAMAIDVPREHSKCEGCGEWWDATGARSTRDYCSEKCRQSIIRTRQDKARELFDQGLTPAKVVAAMTKEFGVTTTPEQAKRWAAASKNRRGARGGGADGR